MFTFDINVYINTGIGEICMESHKVRLKKIRDERTDLKIWYVLHEHY